MGGWGEWEGERGRPDQSTEATRRAPLQASPVSTYRLLFTYLLTTYLLTYLQATPTGPDAVDVAAPYPTDLATCTAVLAQTRVALADTRRQRDALKAAVAAINATAAAATSTIAMM